MVAAEESLRTFDPALNDILMHRKTGGVTKTSDFNGSDTGIWSKSLSLADELCTRQQPEVFDARGHASDLPLGQIQERAKR
jgi:hypothetical protein